MDALEARARWHLEMGYPPPGEEASDLNDDLDDDGSYMGEGVTCWNCYEGTVIDCCDDLCHGQDWCMHGGNRMCPICHGEGVL